MWISMGPTMKQRKMSWRGRIEKWIQIAQDTARSNLFGKDSFDQAQPIPDKRVSHYKAMIGLLLREWPQHMALAVLCHILFIKQAYHESGAPSCRKGPKSE